MLNRLCRTRCVASTPKSGLVPEVTGSGNRFHIWSLCCRLPLLPAFLHIFFLKCGNGAELEYLSLSSKSIPSSIANAHRQNASAAHFTNHQPALKSESAQLSKTHNGVNTEQASSCEGKITSLSPSALDGELSPAAGASPAGRSSSLWSGGGGAPVGGEGVGKTPLSVETGTVFYLLF